MSKLSQEKVLRPIRSFVRREGRMTVTQKESLAKWWPIYGVSLDSEKFDFKHIFGREAPVVLEIGFGNGQSLLKMARDNPDVNYLGVEVYQTGIAKLLYGIQESGLTNIRVCSGDAIDLLQQRIPDDSLSVVQLFFPDPWAKARHHKRRIVQPQFIDLLHSKITHNGVLHMATDWENYAEHIYHVMQKHAGFVELPAKQEFISKRPMTKFEVRGQKLGHNVWDFIYQRQ